jgi:hypothetical protein
MDDDQNYKRRHQWRRTWPGERGLDGKLRDDFVCIVEGENIGRISALDAGPMRNHYKWDAGHSQRINARVLPQGGYATTRLQAVQFVEEHYDRQRKAAGLPPVVGIMEKT